MKAILNKLYNHERLTKLEAKQVLKDIALEKYNDAHLASFMTVFMMRPITVDELAGFRDALKELAIKIDLSDFNTIDIVSENALLNGLEDEEFYFMHSFEVVNYTNILSLTEYEGHKFVSSIHKGNIYGVQFHPEKSRDSGIKLFKNFINIKREK